MKQQQRDITVHVHQHYLHVKFDALDEVNANIAIAQFIAGEPIEEIAGKLHTTTLVLRNLFAVVASAIPGHAATDEEKQKLLSMCQNTNYTGQMQAILLNNSVGMVNYARQQLGIRCPKRTKYHTWPKKDKEFLQQNYGKLSRKQLAQALHTSETDIQVQARLLGITGTKENPIRRNGWQAPGTYEDRCKKRGGWTDEQIAYVKKYASKQTLEQIAIAINKMGKHKKPCTIGRMLKHYGLQTYGILHGYKPHGRPYTAAERKFILNNWQYMSIHEIAAVMADDISAEKVKLFLEQNGITKGRLTHSLPEYTAMAMLRAHNVQFKAFTRVPLIINGKQRRTEVDLLAGNLAIEVQGDYWHGNPATNKTLNTKQRYQQKVDAAKKDALVNAGYAYIALWEHDLIHHPAHAEHQLCAALMNAYVPGDQLTTLIFANSDTMLANVKRQFKNDKALRAVLDHRL